MGSSVVNDRILRFQERMRSNGIGASMIRTLSSFIYFAGTKWLRPAIAGNMVLAAVHTPLSLRDIGAVKFEDTFLVVNGGPKRLTISDIGV